MLAPLLLAFVECFHPYGFGKAVYEGLLPQLKAWMAVHVAQLVLFGAVAGSFWLIIEGLDTWLARLTRLAIIGFLIFYTAFDAIGGLATGILIQIGNSELVQTFYFNPYFGGSHSALSETASFFALFSVWGCAFTLMQSGRGKYTPLFYLLAGPILWNSHAYPYGPIAFSLIFLGNLCYVRTLTKWH